MTKKTSSLITSSTGIFLLLICWILTFISLIHVMSLYEAESQIRTLFLPSSNNKILKNDKIKEDVIEFKYGQEEKKVMKSTIRKIQYPINESLNNPTTIHPNSNKMVTSKITNIVNKESTNEQLISDGATSKQSNAISINTSKSNFITTYGIANNSSAPGEDGKPYIVDINKLSVDEKSEYEHGWQKHQFNLFVSDKISVRRTIPDRRTKKCKSEKFNKNMSSTSIVIVFHNEAWSTLLRTVHSILDRSPPELVKEIILVDDASTFDHLGESLEAYMKLIEKVKIKRTHNRLGLMKARIIGADGSSGDILTFLDAHIECYPGWLEPLLSRISENETNVVCPVIDSISDQTFESFFLSEQNLAVGAFDWHMQFRWKFPSELHRNVSDFDAPFRSPAMAGGLFSIKRSYFYYLGTYDPGMRIWGSENVEMSFRIWMCGGTLEIIPCSHVGHIFRSRSPYNWGESIDKILVVNQRRLVDVWLDEYKEIYYALTGNRNKYDPGDISSRIAIKKKLKCKSFDWYLKNVYPEFYNPLEGQFMGSVKSLSIINNCLDAGDKESKLPLLFPCHNEGGNQLLQISKDGYLRSMDKCLESPHVQWGSCANSVGKGWKYNSKDFLFTDSHSNCLTVSKKEIIAKKCATSIPDINQKWYIIPNKYINLQNVSLHSN